MRVADWPAFGTPEQEPCNLKWVMSLSTLATGLWRPQTNAIALERARLARELHDGVIQSLVGIEMQLEVIRREAAQGAASVASDLERIQVLLREEVLSLRELMQEMRPVDVTPDDLLDHMASMVERFGRDTGISVRFEADRQEVSLPPPICRELTMILREALVNVRKHSGARHVLVRLILEDRRWKLVIDEDGRGFAFTGRYSQAELDSTRRGPIVIKERVRAIGGELTIESAPGHARLEIAVPEAAHG